MSLRASAQSLCQCGFADRPTVPMLSRMPSNELTRRVHAMLLRCEFNPDDDLRAVCDVLGSTREERMEIWDVDGHILLLDCVQYARNAWRMLNTGHEFVFLSQRINETKDPLRKERLIERGRAMVRDLYDRRREALAALDQHLAEEDEAMRATWRHEPVNYVCPFCALVAPDAQGPRARALRPAAA